MKEKEVLKKLNGGLIVSCQALEDEPLHSSFIMAKMALAAKRGGAIGIRANSFEDIEAIKREVNLPVIGIVKRDYEDSEVYITATLKEVEEVIRAGADIIAMDATNRQRPNKQSLEDFYISIRDNYPSVILMADVSTYEEGLRAWELGFDLVATTLSGYTSYTKNIDLPNIELLKSLTTQIDVPVMAEGGIWSNEDIRNAMNSGAHACIVGSAITRPMEITKRFATSFEHTVENNKGEFLE